MLAALVVAGLIVFAPATYKPTSKLTLDAGLRAENYRVDYGVDTGVDGTVDFTADYNETAVSFTAAANYLLSQSVGSTLRPKPKA